MTRIRILISSIPQKESAYNSFLHYNTSGGKYLTVIGAGFIRETTYSSLINPLTSFLFMVAQTLRDNDCLGGDIKFSLFFEELDH